MTKSARLQRNQHSVAPASRVLIVDDSVVARAALSRMVEESSQFDVVAALDGARRAIDWLATQQVDIILLDVQMPGLDGIAALPELIAAGDGARILIVSTLAGEGTRATVEALALGASDTLVKPQAGALGRHFAVLLLEKMEALAEHVRQHPATGVCGDFALRPGAEGAVECLAIGASTGGLHALANFFQALPREFDAPILVTQHLPPVFMPFFAEQLASLSKRHVRVAEDGLVLRHGEIVVAPGTRHLGCACSGRTVRTVLLDEDVPSRCRPSVDPMFAAIARTYGTGALGVVLTGMGRDGEIGAGQLVAAGGTVVVQDMHSSAIWGMPGAIAKAGLASLVASPAELARYTGQRGSRS